MIRLSKYLIFLVAIYSSSLFAETIPHAGILDKRIRHIDYYEQQVYHINAQVGITTHIKFSNEERFEEWYSGDSNAFVLTDHKNYVSFKPIAEKSETNILILTNKRAYNFYVHINKRNGYYGLHFEYPEDEKRKAKQLAALEESKRLLDPDLQANRNIKYIGAGSDFIRPTRVFDNGTHTYLYFPERIDIPSIFRVRHDDKELLTQPITIGNWRVVPRVQESWMLRLGDEVLSVRNLGYTLDQPENKSHTISPTIHRHEKED